MRKELSTKQKNLLAIDAKMDEELREANGIYLNAEQQERIDYIRTLTTIK